MENVADISSVTSTCRGCNALASFLDGIIQLDAINHIIFAVVVWLVIRFARAHFRYQVDLDFCTARIDVAVVLCARFVGYAVPVHLAFINQMKHFRIQTFASDEFVS